MLCQFSRLIYPQDIRAASPDSYMVAVYSPCGKVCDADGNEVAQIKAVGYGLPVSGNLRYEMEGHWSRNSKHGLQFEVTTYNEVIIPTREGVIAYLSSGQIKGIGPKLAEHIYNTFGNMALEVLDKEPEKLLSISGISTGKLKKIRDSYLANRAARDVVAFLTPYGITANRAVKLYRQYKDETMDIVKNHPYRLCEMTGIGFVTADRIAASMGISPLSPERVDEGLLYTLIDAEAHGNLCLEKHAFIKAAVKLLETDGLTSEMVITRAARLLSDGKLVSYHNNIYRRKTAEAEATLANLIHAQLTDRPMHVCKNSDSALDAEEANLGFRLDAEQRKAVTTALTEGLSIITGGPGTGKTAILRAILDIYKSRHPNGEICCCAPTGRAARRMEQSTGYPSSTIHRALGLIANDDGEYGEPHALSADFVVVDEISMLDVITALGLEYPPSGRSSYYVQCPCCDDKPRDKHLNINLKKEVFRCPKCGVYGGMFDLYALYTGIPRNKVRDALVEKIGTSLQNRTRQKSTVSVPQIRECPIADINTRHAVYSALLSNLTLAPDHQQNLLNRGLTEQDIIRLGYKSTPVIGMTAIAKKLMADGFFLSGVPGFYRDTGGQWPLITERRGILIPVRDPEGRIQGMQIRRDDVQKRTFRWVSSADKPDGCRAMGWTHLAGPIRPTMILTEGPMKSDVIHALTGLSVVAVPGVNALTMLRDSLLEMQKEGLREIKTAFDMDFLTNPNVQNGYNNLLALLDTLELRYGTYLWDPRYKGLDDYIWAMQKEKMYQRSRNGENICDEF